MSKLYNEYLSLKAKDSNSFLLFNNGLFYIFLDEDAKKVSQILSLKLTRLNDDVVKCGFPCSQLSKYCDLLNGFDIDFKIIENNFSAVKDSPNYINNSVVGRVVNSIISTDLDDTSPLQALNLLIDFKNSLKNIAI